jgi:hypothetical protein
LSYFIFKPSCRRHHMCDLIYILHHTILLEFFCWIVCANKHYYNICYVHTTDTLLDNPHIQLIIAKVQSQKNKNFFFLFIEVWSTSISIFIKYQFLISLLGFGKNMITYHFFYSHLHCYSQNCLWYRWWHFTGWKQIIWFISTR